MLWSFTLYLFATSTKCYNYKYNQPNEDGHDKTIITSNISKHSWGGSTPDIANVLQDDNFSSKGVSALDAPRAVNHIACSLKEYPTLEQQATLFYILPQSKIFKWQNTPSQQLY